MAPVAALFYSFVFGLLHGVLPDEHTWPITFSYAVGGASGRAGARSALYFAGAFTLQRTLLSEAAYLALAPFLLSPVVNGVVYVAVGLAMSVAGAVVLRRNRYFHLHLLGHHHDAGTKPESNRQIVSRCCDSPGPTSEPVEPPSPRWATIHGFVAGFGFGGFSLFVNTVAAPAMPGPDYGFLPGALFGLGTTISLLAVSALLGASLRRARFLSQSEIQRVGARTGGLTLFLGGLLFAVAGLVSLSGLEAHFQVDLGNLLITLFLVGVAVPSFAYSLRSVLAARRATEPSEPCP